MGKREVLPAKSHNDFYQNLRTRINLWVEKKGDGYKFTNYILLAPDLVYLLCMLVIDKRITTRSRSILAIAVAYFISPIDIIPEAFAGPPGYIDDVVVAVFALNMILNEENQAIIQENWPGEQDILELIQRIIELADEMVGSGAYESIRKMLHNPGEDTESAK